MPRRALRKKSFTVISHSSDTSDSELKSPPRVNINFIYVINVIIKLVNLACMCLDLSHFLENG